MDTGVGVAFPASRNSRVTRYPQLMIIAIVVAMAVFVDVGLASQLWMQRR